VHRALATRPKERSDGFYTIGDVMPWAFHFARSALSLSAARLLRRHISKTVARRSSIGGLYVCAGGLEIQI